MMRQQGDVLLYQTLDDGDIAACRGLVDMDGGLATAVYLSLFGGNEDDPALQDDRLTWWGNTEEPEPTRQYRSRTQHLLRSLPPISDNLRRVEQAVLSDLSWLLDGRIATDLDVSVVLIGRDRVNIEITIQALGDELRLEFTENWRARGGQPQFCPPPLPEPPDLSGCLTLEDGTPLLLEDGSGCIKIEEDTDVRRILLFRELFAAFSVGSASINVGSIPANLVTQTGEEIRIRAQLRAIDASQPINPRVGVTVGGVQVLTSTPSLQAFRQPSASRASIDIDLRLVYDASGGGSCRSTSLTISSTEVPDDFPAHRQRVWSTGSLSIDFTFAQPVELQFLTDAGTYGTLSVNLCTVDYIKAPSA